MNCEVNRDENIAIIGGGWAGIAAAIALADAGEKVTVIEAAFSLGGRAKRVDGALRLDNGQHILSGAYCDTFALMRRVGVSPETLMRRLPFTFMDNAGMRLSLSAPRLAGLDLPEKLRMAWGLFAARGISMRAKWQAALWISRLQRQGFQVEEDCDAQTWLAASGQSPEFCRRFWEPLCLAALNTPAREASARLFARVLRDTLGNHEPESGASDLWIPLTDLSALFPEPAARWLVRHSAAIRLCCRVKRLQPCATGGWTIESPVGRETFRRVILAVAPQHAQALLKDLRGEDAAEPAISSIPAIPDIDCQPPDVFSPIATVYFYYPHSVTLPFPLMALTGGVGQWLLDRGCGRISAVLSGSGDWERLKRAELANLLHQEIGKAVGMTGAEAKDWEIPEYHVLIEKRATFAALPGIARPPQKTPWRDLFLAGDYTWADYPATLEGAVRSGLEGARLCLESVQESGGK